MWFAEGLSWPGKRIPWLALLNPERVAQRVAVAILGTGAPIEREVVVPARGRVAVDLRTWGVPAEYGVEVTCATTCAASLALWDDSYTVPHVSVPVVGCVER